MHSWSVVGQGLARSLIELGIEVDLFSTNGIKHFPEDLKPNLIGYIEENDFKNVHGKLPDNKYDMQISYTSMRNFPIYFNHSQKNKFGIWCYEFAGKNAIPNGFAKHYKYVSKLLPPSHFAKQVFLDSGIPETAMKVVPHGVDLSEYQCAVPFKLKTNKRIKILANIAQPHLRKHLEGLLETYGRAFSKSDDVCLVLKVVDRAPTQPFDVSFRKLYHNFLTKFPNHASIELITEFFNNIIPLYKSCDIVFSMTRGEGFYLPGIECLAAGKLNIVSGYGGQLDFLNDNNSILITGKLAPTPPDALYWESKRGATSWFEPDINDAVRKLIEAVNNYPTLMSQKLPYIQETIKEYTWKKAAQQILDMVEK